MTPLGLPTSNFVLALVASGALVACDAREAAEVRRAREPAAAAPAQAVTGAKFDFYLLAMTVHPAFCADGHQLEAECRVRGARPLAIHGLWPENLTPRTYPRDCPAPPLALDPFLEEQLAELMPGMSDGLHEHEWRKHGGCTGLDDDVYFGRSLELARALDAALAARLTTLEGRETSAAELRQVAELFRPGIGNTFTLHCRTLRDHGNTPVLFELRQCVDNDGPRGAPGTLLECARMKRRDQGCGARFLIAERAG